MKCKFTNVLTAATAPLALTVARDLIPASVIYQMIYATLSSVMTVIEFDEISPNGSLTYFNSTIAEIMVKSLTLELPELKILIKLDDSDVDEFLHALRLETGVVEEEEEKGNVEV